jgi:tetratricopeptide (TPR) repeat protein
MYRAFSRTAEAVALAEQVRDIRVMTLGAFHPDTIYTLMNLGSAYQAAGEPKKALAIFQQAAVGLEKRDFAHAAARLIVWNLCVCLEQFERFNEADLWQQKWLAAAKKRDGPDSLAYADELAKVGGDLVARNRHVVAEPFLRESAAILQNKQPESLTNFLAQSLLGEVLLEQKTYANAEPLLIQGYEGLKAREGQMPPLYRRHRVTEAGQRIVRLYEVWGKAEKAAEWRTKLLNPNNAKAHP